MMKVKVKKTIKNKEIHSMFNDILGENVVPPNIAYSKYNKLRDNTNKLLTLLENFCKGSFVQKYKDYELAMGEILVFTKHGRKEFEEKLPEPPFTEIQIMIPGQVDLKMIENFSKTYKCAKDMNIVKICIKTCNNLITYKSNLVNKNGGFINGISGAEFRPFPFTSFNIKEAFIRNDMEQKFRDYIITLLSLTFEYSYNIYQVYTSCDWDPEMFKSVMQSRLGDIKKEIPRCDRAFKEIENSLDLLKDNIDGYYRDYIASKNPSIMMENFVNDVAHKSNNVDVKTASQFRQIINKYRQSMANKPIDSRTKVLFDHINYIAGDTISTEGHGSADPMDENVEPDDSLLDGTDELLANTDDDIDDLSQQNEIDTSINSNNNFDIKTDNSLESKTQDE